MLNYRRNIYTPSMSKGKLERLLAKSNHTNNDKENLLDYKFLLLSEFFRDVAIEKGFFNGYNADVNTIFLMKNKYWIVNIDAICENFESEYNFPTLDKKVA